MNKIVLKFWFYFFIIISSLILAAVGYKILLKVIYPIKYEEIVTRASEEYDVEKELIYAIIKCESGFNEEAQSSANACGLMQLTPATFKWLLQQYAPNPEIDESCIKIPAVNIKYGTLLISLLRKKYGSDENALSAYNAGGAAVERWLKDKNLSLDGQQLSNIPYKETRDYVKKVQEVKDIYKKLYFK